VNRAQSTSADQRSLKKLRVVHYLNQFFGQVGGEEKAGMGPEVREGVVGPGMAFAKQLGEAAEIVATVICGDNYFGEQVDEAGAEVLKLIQKYKPDLVIAGPAFNAGRYGVACGAVAQRVTEALDLPVITGMYPENPGVEIYRRFAYVIETGNSAAAMRTAVPAMAALVKKIAAGVAIGGPEEEGYIPRGIRKNFFHQERGARRAVGILTKKLKGEEFVTEYPMPNFDRVDIAEPLSKVEDATIALVTSGGIVPRGNPDRIESSSASKYGRYSLKGVEDLTAETHETAHGGYDPVYANDDPDRVLPVDVLRELEKEGAIGRLHPYYYSTVGNGTSVANAKKYASEIAAELVNEGVQAVILTST